MDFSSSSPAISFTCLNTRKKKKRNKARFSDKQIRSLESIFESESKLEPQKKLQLARDLGLQPRQVAIWFQNKRARWKSKQLEQEYNILEADYKSLASLFETLKKENRDLNIQLQKMNDVMQNPRERSQHFCRQGPDGSEVIKVERMEHREGEGVLLDDGSSIKSEYFGLEEEGDPLNMVELSGDASLTSTGNPDWFDTDALFAESSSNYHWWDFWS